MPGCPNVRGPAADDAVPIAFSRQSNIGLPELPVLMSVWKNPPAEGCPGAALTRGV
jgi:hypothetical protein